MCTRSLWEFYMIDLLLKNLAYKGKILSSHNCFLFIANLPAIRCIIYQISNFWNFDFSAVSALIPFFIDKLIH